MPYTHELDEGEGRELLRIARATLRERLSSGRTPPGAPHRVTLRDPASVFIGLYAGAKLRGCSGTTEEERPLYQAVQEMAIDAATRDRRFAPVRPSELSALTVELWVLSHRVVVSATQVLTHLVLGTHGLALSAGELRAIALPQVATEHGWDADTFLGETCKEAGLEADAWQRPETKLVTFRPQVFDERALGLGGVAPVRAAD